MTSNKLCQTQRLAVPAPHTGSQPRGWIGPYARALDERSQLQGSATPGDRLVHGSRSTIKKDINGPRKRSRLGLRRPRTEPEVKVGLGWVPGLGPVIPNRFGGRTKSVYGVGCDGVWTCPNTPWFYSRTCPNSRCPLNRLVLATRWDVMLCGYAQTLHVP